MQVGSIERRLVQRVATVGYALNLPKPAIMEGWKRAREVAERVSSKDYLDVKVSLNRHQLFPDVKPYGCSFDALTGRISTRSKTIHNTLGSAAQSLIETCCDKEVEMSGMFTFIPILRQEAVTCSVQSAANEFAPGEQAVSAWDYLLFLLSDPPRQKLRTFVATEDRLTESVPGEYHFSPAVVHAHAQIRIIKVHRHAKSNGTILHQLVRTKCAF